ncbi:type VI secretion system protein ImpL [Devosia sp. UYZn731]|uniref:type VI secretion system membrane subunit TssM n=1 Tax=Devosia sp. UYZn731 TaxID=3156345 RepID=UPI003391D112
MKFWLFLALLALGLVAFAALVWFGLPLIAWGGVAPFEPEWIRILIIAVGWGIVGVIYLIRFLLRRRAARRLEAAMATGADSDEKVLGERMTEALAMLRTSSGKGAAVYSLPWYIIIGAPGTGKTTALVNSGLKFVGPAGKPAPIAGIGGTRYCDWWFTEDAVLIDTAGRYTTQDSDQHADAESWLSFLGLLKKNRPKQPINGAIVAISLVELMQKSPTELAEQTTAIRKRLAELHDQLKIDFPVYMMFTMADLVAGFTEYFGNFTESRRRKVWGATFQTEDRRANMVGSVPGEMDDLVRRLTEELADRLQEEPDAASRIAIYGFPGQFALLREKIATTLAQIFEPNRFQAPATLRGFYFTSGTQEGTPIDQVLGAMGRAFGPGGQRQLSGGGKSFFLHDLLTQVIFGESGWVSIDRAAVRAQFLLRTAVLSLIGLGLVVAMAAWGWSYFNNDALLSVTDQSVANYRVAAGDLLNAATVNDFDLESVTPALDLLASMPVGYDNREAATPVGETFGLSQRSQLTAAAESTYYRALERMLRSRLILRLEAQLGQIMDDPMAVYEALKVYLMLCGTADTVDDDYIVAWMKHDWEQNLYQGPNYRPLREDLERHLRAMLTLARTRPPSFEPNGTLIDSARTTLTRLSLADQAYSYLRSTVQVPDIVVADRLGPDSRTIFETVDASDFSAMTIPGFFTYSGFHDHLLNELSSIADRLQGELWVRGEAGRDMVSDDAFAHLGPQLISIYSKDFVATWANMLNNLKLRTLPGEKPDYTVMSIVSNPATSPIRSLVELVASESALTKDVAPEEPASAASGTDPLATAATNLLASRTSGLAKIGIAMALDKSNLRPGEQPSLPGGDIEAQFADYAALVSGTPRPIDAVIANLNEIYQNLVIAARNPTQPAGAAAAQLAVSNLTVNASRLPNAMRRMLSAAAEDLEGDAAGTSLAQLNQKLAGEVTRVCEQVTSDFYPFSPGSPRDVPMADFSRLFRPGGVLDKFFADNLINLADLSGDDWKWRDDTALGRELSNNAIKEFQRAAQIRDAFFPPNAAEPSVSLTIGQTMLNPAADMAMLDINGTVLQSQQVGSTPITVQWPTSQGSGAVTLSMLPELPGRSSTVTISGPWALMRLIDRNTVARRGDELRLRIVLDGRDVEYGIRVGTIFNPFFLPALSEFSCPGGL